MVMVHGCPAGDHGTSRSCDQIVLTHSFFATRPGIRNLFHTIILSLPGLKAWQSHGRWLIDQQVITRFFGFALA